MVKLVGFDPPFGKRHERRRIIVFVGKKRVKRQTYVVALLVDFFWCKQKLLWRVLCLVKSYSILCGFEV